MFQSKKTRQNRPDRVRRGFTLVELLVVIVILAILIGLLLPAINAALRTARKAAVSSEINQIASALAAFKSKYGDYPPSRFLAVENGNYTQFFSSTSALGTASVAGFQDPTSPGTGTGDINLGQLAQRSAAALRKFWPRVSTSSAPSGQFYDFNGNGIQDSLPYVLHGHECLVFFLGGIANQDSSGNFGMSGFDKNPVNPFTNNIVGNSNYGPNRQSPLFEFVPSRLFADPSNPAAQVPAYIDSLGSAPSATAMNFYAYFSAYGNNGYDPNDVNLIVASGTSYSYELDARNDPADGPIGLSFSVAFPTYGTTNNVAGSPSPNPYTSTLTENSSVNPNGPPAVTFLNAQSFQIISSGIDGLYGVGGQFISSSTASSTSTNPLPLDPSTNTPYININDPTVRQREQDNLTNFKGGSLQ